MWWRGRYFHLGRVQLLFEADGAFGGLPAAARQVDPVGLDETAASELHWVGTARIGVRRSLGSVGVFVTGGVSVAGISNSFTDLDVGTDGRAAGGPRRFLRRAVDAGRVGRRGRHRKTGGRCLDPPIRRPLQGFRQRPSTKRRTGLASTPASCGPERALEPLPLRLRPAVRSPPSGPHSPPWPVIAALRNQGARTASSVSSQR